MFIVKRIIFMNEVLYFEDDTKWTPNKLKAKKFETKKEAIKSSDSTGLYELILEEVT
jgi:hypothetical protein